MADRTPGAVSSVAAPQQTQDTATHFAAIESAPAYRLVFETIEREILDGRLALGDRLPTEAELAARLGVHRSTTREGLRLLEESGLVQRRTGRRLYASAPRAEDLSTRASRALALQRVSFDELWQLLLALEPAAAAQAALAIQPEQIEALEDNLARTRVAVAEGSILTTLDLEFHALIAEATGNATWQLAREPAAMLLFPANERMLPRLSQAGARLIEAHEHIIAAFKKRDATLAADWMRRHINDFRRGYVLAGCDPDEPVHLSATQKGGARR
ncbi:FCD domain-containing protein [Aurantimonas sp. E1-2-R+4]|uniref:FadR/GntR family transcriptional regulator n=1 Tax=Aurantimonas sp. E1-2-R+4 TaxID=3113714 RepID=UPI002F927177